MQRDCHFGRIGWISCLFAIKKGVPKDSFLFTQRVIGLELRAGGGIGLTVTLDEEASVAEELTSLSPALP